jgi:YVTN family beta-propeller protein
VTNRGGSTITVIDTLTNAVVTHIAADYPTESLSIPREPGLTWRRRN